MTPTHVAAVACLAASLASARPARAHDPITAPDEIIKVQALAPAIDQTSTSESMTISRGVAEEFLVLPDGGQLGGQLRTITAGSGGLGDGALKLTDVALFDLAGSAAIAEHYELDGKVSMLAKQPSTTREPVFQGGALTLRRDLFAQTAISLTGSAAPLVDLRGHAFGGALMIAHKKRLNQYVTFALAAGASATLVRARGSTTPPMVDAAALAVDRADPALVEAGGHAAVLVRIPEGRWGGWLGAGYSVPLAHRGRDPVSDMPLAPQPRLDLDLGSAVQLAARWDLSIELAILDRGDLDKPATRLPILDGGFDQIQITIGVTRRLGGADRDDTW